MNDFDSDIEHMRHSTGAAFLLAGGLIVSWGLIPLLGGHMFGIMAMFLHPAAGAWTSLSGLVGCATIVSSAVFDERRHRDRGMLFGSTLLLAVVVKALLEGVVVSVLVAGWPFVILWSRLARRVLED